MKKLIIAIAILAIAAAFILLFIRTAGKEPAQTEGVVTHAQDTWERALEWCESRGLLEAVNPEDLDGTPSYYSWQWKPETFLAYAIKYGLLPKETTLIQAKEKMKDYGWQKNILDRMINDSEIRWEQEFPGCVKKLGKPPKY